LLDREFNSPASPPFSNLRRGPFATLTPHNATESAADDDLDDGGNEGDLIQTMGWKSRAMIDRYARSVADARARDAHDDHSARNLI
jgi:hypothetical protein